MVHHRAGTDDGYHPFKNLSRSYLLRVFRGLGGSLVCDAVGGARRIQRLEDSLGEPLFARLRAGAELTSARREFEKYALSMIRVCEESRQEIAIPEGYTRSLTVGAQYSLGLVGFRWVDALQDWMLDLDVRAELGMPDCLTRFLIEGVMKAGLLYMPQLRPGLEAEQILSEERVMVATFADADMDTIFDDFVFIDWGPAFVAAHA